MSRTIVLPPASEEMAARQAGARGQSVEEYLSALVTDALARRASEELPDAGRDSLGFWEQEMDRRRLEPPG
jgi:hypothetical protein